MSKRQSARAAPDAVNALAEDLANGRIEAARLLFAEAGLAAPSVVWSPLDADIRQPMARAFARLFKDAKRGANGFPLADYEALDLTPYVDWLAILSPVGDGDFIYEALGRNITAYVGDIERKRLSTLPGRNTLFRTALHQAVTLRGEMALSLHDPAIADFTEIWTRVIVPVASETGEVVRIVSLAVLENELRPGLDILPDAALVVELDGAIRFANIAAQSLFGRRSFVREPAKLVDYCGFDINMAAARFDIQGLHPPSERVAGVIGDAAIVHFDVRVNPIFFHDRPLKLVLIRPEETF